MSDVVLAVSIVVGFAVFVAHVHCFGKEQLRFGKEQLRWLKEAVKLARRRKADEFGRFCHPHLYPHFQSELRVRYWEDRHLRAHPKYSPPWFKAMKRWEGNSFETTAYRSLWEGIRGYEEGARAHTDLNDLEIEFLWQHRLSYSHLLAEDALKDDHIPTQVSVKSLQDQLRRDLDGFRRRDQRPADQTSSAPVWQTENQRWEEIRRLTKGLSPAAFEVFLCRRYGCEPGNSWVGEVSKLREAVGNEAAVAKVVARDKELAPAHQRAF